MSLTTQYSARATLPLVPRVYFADGCYKESRSGECRCGAWREIGARLVPAPWTRPALVAVLDHGHNRFGAKHNFRCADCSAVVHKGDTAGYDYLNNLVCDSCWTCERDNCDEC